MLTLNDLAQRALQQRGVYAAGEALTADDIALLEASFRQAFDELEAFDLAVWDLNATPLGLADAFISYTAPSFMGAFGQPFDDAQAEAQRRLAMGRLRALVERGFRGMRPAPEYF
jgi:hypothetical protein